MDNSDKTSAFIRNSIIIVLLNVCVIYGFGQFIDDYQINSFADNARDSDVGVFFLIFWMMFTPLVFSGLSVTEHFSFININNEKSAAISYIILGVFANLVGFIVILLFLHLTK